MMARFALILGFISALLGSVAAVQAEQIRDLVTIQGVRDNPLIGYGIVVGLDGTGDQTSQTPFTVQSITNMLSQLGITVPSGTNMQLKNVAAVMVTANLPPFARTGQTINVVVSSLGNAKSLRGGTLIMTPLKGVDSQIYALAQGNLIVGGAGASSGGSSVAVNQLSGASIPNGAVVERELPSQFASNNTLHLQLKEDDFTVAQMITDVVNRWRGGTAEALDSRTVSLKMPFTPDEKVRFLSQIQNLSINRAPVSAKIIINARTGTVVLNRNVSLDNCAVAQGNLSVVVNNQLQVSQPNTPFGGGQTVVTPQTDITVSESGGSLHRIQSSADLNQVITGLNALGASPTELVSILQAMKSAGCIKASIEVI